MLLQQHTQSKNGPVGPCHPQETEYQPQYTEGCAVTSFNCKALSSVLSLLIQSSLG